MRRNCPEVSSIGVVPSGSEWIFSTLETCNLTRVSHRLKLTGISASSPCHSGQSARPGQPNPNAADRLSVCPTIGGKIPSALHFQRAREEDLDQNRQ
jgi:hypothetical protein